MIQGLCWVTSLWRTSIHRKWTTLSATRSSRAVSPAPSVAGWQPPFPSIATWSPKAGTRGGCFATPPDLPSKSWFGRFASLALGPNGVPGRPSPSKGVSWYRGYLFCTELSCPTTCPGCYSPGCYCCANCDNLQATTPPQAIAITSALTSRSIKR